MARASGWRSLRVKWTLAVLVVVVLPVVVLGFVVLDIQRAGLDRAEKELEAAIVDEAARSVKGAVDEAADVAGRAAATFADESLPVDARERLISESVARAPRLSGVAFFDDEGRFVDAVVARGAPLDPTLRVPPAGTGFRVVEHTLRYERPLPNGRIVATIAPSALEQRLREISEVRFGAPGRVVLVDERHEALTSGARAPAIVAKTRATFGAPLLLTTEYEEGGVAMVGTLRTMPEERLAVVVERPAAEAYGALTAARRAFAVALAALGLLSVAAAVLVVGRVTGPIRALMDLVDRYSRREFEAKSTVTSGDELETLGASLEKMAGDLATSEREIERRARTEASLLRYVPDPSVASLDLGGTKARVTIVFADVVAFTRFAEKTSPERSVAFLNELFTILSEIVFRHDGMVDKFIGDCIMAVFRAPAEVPRALAAAEDMHAFVASNAARFRDAYGFAVELGIGVATGEVLIGNLGSDTRMEYTVIGDAVNVAARLESIARPRQTLTTRAVVDACPDLAFTALGQHTLRGREAPVEVYEVAS